MSTRQRAARAQGVAGLTALVASIACVAADSAAGLAGVPGAGSAPATTVCSQQRGYEGVPACDNCDDFRASHYLWFQAEAQQALVTSQCVIWQYGCKLQCAEKKTCSPPPPGCTNRTRKPCARKCKSTVRKSCERVCRDTTCTQTCSTQAGGFTLPLTTLRMVDVPAGGTCPSAPPLSCQSTCSTDHCTTVLERSGGRTLLGHHPPLGVHCGSVPGTADDAQPLKASRRLLQRERRARQTRPTDAPRPPRRTRASRPMDPPRVRLSREGSAQRSRSGDAAGATSTSLDDDTATPTRVRSTNDDDSNDSDMAALGVYGGSGAVGVYGADEPGTVRGADDLVDGNAQDGAVFDEPDVLAPSTSATQPATAAATADALAPGPATRPLAADGWASAAAAGAPPEGGVLDQSFQGGGAVAIGRAAAPAAAVWDGCNPICKEECTDPTDVCAGKHGVIYFVAATQELVDPTEAGCTISCEPQEQECSSDCVFEEVCDEDCEDISGDGCEEAERCTFEESCEAQCNDVNDFSYCWCEL